ncbi:porphyrin biosynthesis-like protein [Betaproteobacteria bacterium]|nr:porphyrin biosynthesis-like protein [Betaproteobacteria bacterium]
MRALIWFITLFALAAGLSILANHLNQGYVLLVHWPWRVQVSLGFFVVALLVVFAVSYLLLRLLRRVYTLPHAVNQWRERRQRIRSDRALRDALRTFHEGRYAQTLKLAASAFSSGDHPAVAALLAARAAHALADDTRYRIWISRATEQGEEARVARLMTEAELAIVSRRFEEARECLETLKASGHRHIAVLRLSLKVASALNQWEEVLKLTRQLRKHKALSTEQALPLLRRAHFERLREHAGDGEALARLWSEIPASELADRYLVEQACPLLAATAQGALARRVLERLLDEQWDSDLARSYAYCASDSSDASSCLAKGEHWLREHPRDPGLLFALGRLCITAQLWGKALSYLEASLGLLPAAEVHLTLARLLERLERPDDAQAHYYRAATERVTTW